MDSYLKTQCNNIVCICIPCLGLGGTEMQTLSLVRVLRACGCEVFVVCYFEHEESIVFEFKNAGAVIRLLNLNRNSGSLSIIFKIRKEIYSIHPDVVHIQYMAPGALPIIAARLAGVKTVFATVHQPWTPSHGKFSKLILRIASLLSTRFIAVSVNAEKSWFGSGNLFDENKPVKLQPHHFTVYNSVDAIRIQNIAGSVNTNLLKQSLFIPVGIPIIGSVSRLNKEKGIDLLIEAFVKLAKESAPAHLLIAGSGHDEGKLKKMADSYGLSNHVTFCGGSDWETAMGLMALMDIVVVPSRFEGFGLTAIEAMAAGKPVVASDCFGLKEVVADNCSGLLFKTGDVYDLKVKLEMLLFSGDLCKQFGNAGKERVELFFNMNIFKRKIKALYFNFKG